MTVDELFAQVVPRLNDKPQCSLVDAVGRAQTIIVNRLFLKRSSLLRENATGSVSANDEYFTLRAGKGGKFLSIAGEPYYLESGARKYLQPFDAAISVSATAAAPKYYERIGRKVYIYPVPDASYDISVPVYAAPVSPTEGGDELPFDGLLDDVMVEAVYAVMKNGTSAVADPAFTAAIQSQVDQVLLSIDAAEEQNLADSLNYR